MISCDDPYAWEAGSPPLWRNDGRDTAPPNERIEPVEILTEQYI